jgi:hypothetical protein
LCRKDKPFEGREDDVQAFYDFKDNHRLPRQHKSLSGAGAILFEVRPFFFCNFISFVPRGGRPDHARKACEREGVAAAFWAQFSYFGVFRAGHRRIF